MDGHFLVVQKESASRLGDCPYNGSMASTSSTQKGGFCPNCGSAHNDNGRFCGSCGALRPVQDFGSKVSSDDITVQSFSNSEIVEKPIFKFEEPKRKQSKNPGFITQFEPPIKDMDDSQAAVSIFEDLEKPQKVTGKVEASTSEMSVDRSKDAVFEGAVAQSGPPKLNVKPAILLGVIAVLGLGIGVAINHQSTPSQDSASSNVQLNQQGSTEVATPIAKPTNSRTPEPKKSNVAKASPTPINTCEVTSKAITDLVRFRNSASTVVGGSNDAANQSRILAWIAGAESVSSALQDDLPALKGPITGWIEKAANDLTDLSLLATNWANKELSDPANFGNDYASGTQRIQNDYTSIYKSCNGKVPGF